MSGFVFGTVGSPRTTPAKPGGSVGAVEHSAALGVMALELGWGPAGRGPQTASGGGRGGGGKPAMLGSLEDVLALSREVEGGEPCLDFAHLHARPGDGSMNTFEEWSAVLRRYAEVLGAASLQRLHIHCSGIEYGAKGERKHLPLVDSDLDLAGLLRALADQGCGGRILCESPV